MRWMVIANETAWEGRIDMAGVGGLHCDIVCASLMYCHSTIV